MSLVKILNERPKSFLGEWLSVSKVKTFKECPAKFRYCYIERLPRKTWDFHVFGKFSHSSLEKFHELIKNGDERPNNEIMTDAFKFAAEEHVQATTAQKKEIWLLMNDYLNKVAEDSKNNLMPKVIDVEENFYIDIDGKVLLNGFIDRVQVDSDGIIHVADYKTTKNKSYLKNDNLQLKTYAYVKCLQNPKIEKIRTSYILLRHNFEFIIQEFTKKEVMEIEDIFLKYAKEIQDEKLWRPHTSGLCRFCDFLEVCPVGRGKSTKEINIKFGEQDWS